MKPRKESAEHFSTQLKKSAQPRRGEVRPPQNLQVFDAVMKYKHYQTDTNIETALSKNEDFSFWKSQMSREAEETRQEAGPQH